MKKILFFLFVSFIMINPLKAQDPYGCVVFYNGATTLFTNYSNTVGTTRYYKNTPAKNYYVRYDNSDPHCGILVQYTSPYSGGCSVIGLTTGSFATRTSMNTCPIDDYLPLLLLIAGGLGFFWLKSNDVLISG